MLLPTALTVFYIFCAAGAVAPLMVSPRNTPIILSITGSCAAISLLFFALLDLHHDGHYQSDLWPLFPFGQLKIAADPLCAIFLAIAGIVFFPVSIFSSRYLEKYTATYNLRYFSVVYHGLLASIVLVLIAADAVLFLIAWELMSIASYLLVNFEHDHEESAAAGYVMLAMSEAGTIAVALAFLLLGGSANTLDFATLKSMAIMHSEGIRWAIFLLSFFGFAVKAGLVPLNSWLPLAHPVAPTNVSALLSAVIVNLGIYGIIRINIDLAPPINVIPALIVLVIGSVSALIGILYATVQPELKRLLAHSTIENMGIVAAGIGASMAFFATDHLVVAGIALIAALYHLANHSVYKSLLFIGTGAIEAGTGTRDLDRLGGIIRKMPWSSAFVLIGVLSISALPPFNGFVSEWLTLQTILRSTLFSSAVIKVIFAICGAILALTAGLAVTCFAKVFAMGFLGMPRSNGAENATESKVATLTSLAILAAFCVGLGLLPTYIIPTLDRATKPLVGQSATASLVPPFFIAHDQIQENVPSSFIEDFGNLGAQVGKDMLPGRGLVILHRGEKDNPVVFAMSTSYMALMLAIILLLTYMVFRRLTRTRKIKVSMVWAGGLKRLQSELTYTATAFTNPVRVVFENILSPRSGEDNVEAVAQHFRTAIVRNLAMIPVIDRWMLKPPVLLLQILAQFIRRMHVGHVNAYAGYVLLTMLLVLLVGIGLR